MKPEKRKLTGFKRNMSAYLTVYLALSMTIMLSLCMALIEGVRSNAIRLEAECVMDIGLHSILAEYHRELFAQYNLLAIDSSYGTLSCGRTNTEEHLREYIERNMRTEDIFLEKLLYKDFLAMEPEDIELTQVLILTDNKGEAFRRQATAAMKDDVGITMLQELLDWMQTVEINNLTESDIAAQKRSVDEKLQSFNGKKVQISEDAWETIEIVNPTGKLEENRSKGVLSLVVEDTSKLSTRCITEEGLAGSRMKQGKINRGNVMLPELSESEKLLERFLFQEYLLKYMGCYGSGFEENVLSYQTEYLIAGKACDLDNLKSVVNCLSAIREAANAIYIFSDSEKCAEAELAATLICSLLQVPELTYLLKIAMLLGWAYAESLYDIEVLLQGGRVPLIKSRETWHYGLEGALSGFQRTEGAGGTIGLSYKDYLRIMLMLTDIDVVTERAMNLVEANIRMTPGNAAFRLDGCYVWTQVAMEVKSAYGYSYEITRQRGY